MTKLDFPQIYAENYKDVLSFVISKIHNINESKDLTGEIFEKIYKNIDVFDCNKAQFTTWIYTISKNHVIDYVRMKKRNGVYVNLYDSETGKQKFDFVDNSETNEKMETSELSAKMLQAFQSLQPKYRKIAVLYFMRQKQYNEIAEICDIPMGTVKGMISRVREMLQKELKNEYANL